MPRPVNAGGKQGRDGRGRFRKGASGNPSGKPQGVRNRTTRDAEAMLDNEAAAITRRCIELAIEGHPVALRLALERILPPRRELPISLEMPSLEPAVSGKGDPLIPVLAGERRVIEALASGELLPSEGLQLMKVLGSHRDTIRRDQVDGGDELGNSIVDVAFDPDACPRCSHQADGDEEEGK